MKHLLPNGLEYKKTKEALFSLDREYMSWDEFEDKYHDLLLQQLEASPDMRVEGYAPLTILRFISKQWYSKRKLNRQRLYDVLESTEGDDVYEPCLDLRVQVDRGLQRLSRSPVRKQCLFLAAAGYGEQEGADLMGISRQTYWRNVKEARALVQGSELRRER